MFYNRNSNSIVKSKNNFKQCNKNNTNNNEWNNINVINEYYN